MVGYWVKRKRRRGRRREWDGPELGWLKVEEVEQEALWLQEPWKQKEHGWVAWAVLQQLPGRCGQWPWSTGPGAV